MLLSSCVVWRHRTLEDVPRRVPARRRGAAAVDLGAARRVARVARVASACAGLGGHREPADDRPALRPARAHRGSGARAGRSGCGSRLPRRPSSSSSRRAASRCAWRASGACSSARTAGARATGSTTRAAAARRRPASWTSSTRARCRRRPPGSRSPTTCALSQLYGGSRAASRTSAARSSSRSRPLARERPGAGDRATAGRPAWFELDDGGAPERGRERQRACEAREAGGRRGGRPLRVHVVRGRHAHDRRAARRRARPRARGTARRSRGSSRRAWTWAASRAAATRAASRRRSSSGSSPPRSPLSRWLRGRADAVVAGERRDAELRDLEVRSSSSSTRSPGSRRLAVAARGARSRSASRRRAGRSRSAEILLGDVRGSVTRTVVPLSSSRWSTSKLAVQRARALFELVERRPPPLARSVVDDLRLQPAVGTARDDDRHAGRRPAPDRPGGASRMIW